MRVRLAVKLLILAGLAIGSSAATSSLLAGGRVRPGRAAKAPVRKVVSKGVPGPPQGSTTVTILDPATAARRALEFRPPGAHSIAGGSMQRLDIVASGKWIYIKALVHIRDTRPDMSYLWSVRVLDPNDPKREKVLFEKRYEDQMFQMPQEQVLNPTFEDAIELSVPPGTYPIEVTAFMIPPRLDLNRLGDPKVAIGLRGPSGRRRVTITNAN